MSRTSLHGQDSLSEAMRQISSTTIRGVGAETRVTIPDSSRKISGPGVAGGSRRLAARGACVIGVDLAEEMIAIAHTKAPELDFRVGSCSDLAGIDDATIDLVVSNYVLMDTPDLAGALRSFHRVLKPQGAAVVVFSHPCFPQGRAVATADGGVRYEWGFVYFEPCKVVDPPWGHFRDDFVWFHRPLSDYWKAFRAAGFEIEELEEPRIAPARYPLAESQKTLRNSRTRPYSVAFRLRKPRAPKATRRGPSRE